MEKNDSGYDPIKIFFISILFIIALMPLIISINAKEQNANKFLEHYGVKIDILNSTIRIRSTLVLESFGNSFPHYDYDGYSQTHLADIDLSYEEKEIVIGSLAQNFPSNTKLSFLNFPENEKGELLSIINENFPNHYESIDFVYSREEDKYPSF